MLDPALLDRPKHRYGKLVCACPACREEGRDKAGEHLAVFDSGAYRCAVDDSQPHRRRIFELAGVRSPSMPAGLPIARHPAHTEPRTRPAPSKPRLPQLRPLNVTEMARLAEHRKWPLFAGLELLTRRGLLWHGRVWDGGVEHDAWIITDSDRLNAQARRVDGKPWQCGKAKTLPGSNAFRPVGLAEARDYTHIILCEGGPDFLAALLVAWWGGCAAEVAPVGMLGAGLDIPADALGHFEGKAVSIAMHADTGHSKGQNAAQRWADQLREAGAEWVGFLDFRHTMLASGTPCKDLADFATTLQLPEPES